MIAPSKMIAHLFRTNDRHLFIPTKSDRPFQDDRRLTPSQMIAPSKMIAVLTPSTSDHPFTLSQMIAFYKTITPQPFK
jgi:hypothetical protein